MAAKGFLAQGLLGDRALPGPTPGAGRQIGDLSLYTVAPDLTPAKDNFTYASRADS